MSTGIPLRFPTPDACQLAITQPLRAIGSSMSRFSRPNACQSFTAQLTAPRCPCSSPRRGSGLVLELSLRVDLVQGREVAAVERGQQPLHRRHILCGRGPSSISPVCRLVDKSEIAVIQTTLADQLVRCVTFATTDRHAAKTAAPAADAEGIRNARKGLREGVKPQPSPRQ